MHFFTDSLQGVCKLLSDLLLQRHQVCCGGHTCLLLCDCCCCRGSRWPSTDSTSDGAYQRSATMSNAILFCCNLAPAQLRWKNGRVHATTLRHGKQNVQQCNSVKITCVLTTIDRERQRDNGRQRESHRFSFNTTLSAKRPASPRNNTAAQTKAKRTDTANQSKSTPGSKHPK